jgi:tRNA threonylcarbamoyladenosine biosynthesis protein TsaE
MRRTEVADESAMMVLGAELAQQCVQPCCVFLRGELGAGKTTFSRGFLHEKGHEGAVISPSYQLVQVYELPKSVVVHVDLYRLSGAADFESLGLMDFWGSAIWLVEWPEHGADSWLVADIICDFSLAANKHFAEIISVSDKGEKLLQGGSFSE